MRRGLLSLLLVAAACAAALPAGAIELPGMPRLDVIWARVSPEPITLDGVLDEPGWAAAESVVVRFGYTSSIIPGSGWKIEATYIPPSQFDSTYAVLKLLARDNQIYLGARMKDRSVGGSKEFNRFDGLLMAVKDHLSPLAPKPPKEYFYSWWYPTLNDPQPAGQLPRFAGAYGDSAGLPRPPESVAAWDARTVVHGTSNDDSTPDTGWTVEMRFDCGVVGYDITQPAGDTFEWNISIYDCDGWWPLSTTAFSATRTWLQGPWGNSSGYNEMRVMSRPDVTTASGPVPEVLPEIVYPWVSGTPTVDGQLTDGVWSDPDVYSFDIRFGDLALRDTYPAVGPHRAGQYQPVINGGEAYVVDPGDATVRLFLSGNRLYMGFDVRDQAVQYHPAELRWDGFWVHVTEIDSLEIVDHALRGKRLGFQVAQNGTAQATGYLANLISQGKAQLALQLKAGTTVDTTGVDTDAGYTAELSVDLTDFGYTPGNVSGPLFLGVVLMDGDSYLPIEDSYGTKTWWFREYDNTCCPPWGYIPASMTGVAPPPDGEPRAYGEAQGYPNPSLQPRIRYALPERNRVTLEVFDVRGRLVERRPLGTQPEGQREIELFAGRPPGSGVYLYRLQLENPETGRLRGTLTGKVIVLN